MMVVLAERQGARPYELGDVRLVLREVVSRPALDLLEWLLAAELGFQGSRGVVMRHSDAAKLVGVCRRRAGDAMRELVAVGLVKQRPHFRVREAAERVPQTRNEVINGCRKLDEQTPAYQTTARCREVVARKAARITRKNMVGRKAQPGESHLPLQGRIKGVPSAARPERTFVAEVKRALAPVKAPSDVAIVIERRPDGSVALAQELSADSLAQKLRREGATRLRNLDEDVTLAGWRAFEANERRQGR